MSHHAIYIGDSQIVHFTGGAGADTGASLAAKSQARIQRESVMAIVSLANAAQAFLVVQPPSGSDGRDRVVARALSRVGDAGYNLVLSNCEHFAHWCETGESRSQQVLKAFQAPARFVSEVADDLVEVSKHPVKGKPMRHIVGTVKTALAVASAHLTLFSW